MTWEEFIRPKPTNTYNTINRQLTEIECPQCGKYIYKRLDMIYTSFPPQNKYECDCGWVGFSSN